MYNTLQIENVDNGHDALNTILPVLPSSSIALAWWFRVGLILQVLFEVDWIHSYSIQDSFQV